jgi:4-diphosphocytidyl-2-C-methyl-D-erythritol kinase
MIAFPFCKINLGLQVIGRREDGYHDIATIFYPLPLYDALEIIVSEQHVFRISGQPVPGPEDQNLCLRAYHMLKQDFPQLPALQVYLHKAIPMGAGLGGGSSDAAAMLALLNDKFRLELDRAALSRYATRLGSDCTFFLQKQACYATGRGEQMDPFEQEELDRCSIVLVCPEIPISTPWAYGQIKPHPPDYSLREAALSPVAQWKSYIANDFEQPVFEAYPVLADIKQTLYQRGAHYASLSGSGSAIYGIFPPGKEGKPEDWPFKQASVFVFPAGRSIR